MHGLFCNTALGFLFIKLIFFFSIIASFFHDAIIACVRIFPTEKRRRAQDWRKKDKNDFNSVNPYFEGVVSTLDEINVSPGQRFTADTTIVILDEFCLVPQQRNTF